MPRALHLPRPRSLLSSLCRRLSRRRPRPRPPPPPRAASQPALPHRKPVVDDPAEHAFTDDVLVFATECPGSDDPCPICLEPLHPRANKGVTTGRCRHHVHTACILKWLRYDSAWSCPVCRAPLVPADKSSYSQDDALTDGDTVTDIATVRTASDVSALTCSFEDLGDDGLDDYLQEIAVMSNHDVLADIWVGSVPQIVRENDWGDSLFSDEDNVDDEYEHVPFNTGLSSSYSERVR